MPRSFNTAGPNRPEIHYTLPALARLPEVRALVEGQQWFVLHAPRQSGKTTAMRSLASELTASGAYAALWATCEMGEPYGDNGDIASRLVCQSIASNALDDLPAELRPPPVAADAPEGGALADLLQRWSRACPRPVVLLLDEIDALRDGALISVLRQLRGIYPSRPRSAPSSLALIGLRDVRDYKVTTSSAGQLGTASPFNIKAEALTLDNFSQTDVADLYGQHTAETGQVFTADAVALAFELTQGQPWLVNALAYELVRRMKVQGEIGAAHVQVAKERLILSRATHLDSLADKLNEARVRAVVEPLLTGEPGPPVRTADLSYCIDLGLVVSDGQGTRIANPIYREVLPRELTVSAQFSMPQTEPMAQRRWARPDGRLDLDGLLRAFVDFWRQHGEWMVRGRSWPEAAHQIVLMAFLQRLINGGGTIEREYGLGTRRLDLLITWHNRVDAHGIPLEHERFALEVKVWRDGRGDPLAEGLAQLDAYCGRLGLDAGTLLVFDARSDAGLAWEARGTFEATTSPAGRAVTLVRL